MLNDVQVLLFASEMYILKLNMLLMHNISILVLGTISSHPSVIIVRVVC